MSQLIQQTLPVFLSRESFGDFITLLNEHQIKYQMQDMRSGVVMASSGVIELVQGLGNAAMWGALATVIVAFINRRKGRKVIITTKDNIIIHVEGLSIEELEVALEHARNINLIDSVAKHSDESIE